MAERQRYDEIQVEDHPTLPQKGKVKDVCQKWLVHEDGALAYVIQNKEIDHHLGMNRFHRRTVREDVPVAKSAQQEEEVRQQEERLQQLELLSKQAADDEVLAKEIAEKLEHDEQLQSRSRNKSDEEYARQMQLREQRRYTRQREKRQERHLERERHHLEERLLKQSEEAGITAAGHDSGSQSAGDTSFNSGDHDISSPPKDSSTRVTPAGVIEDEGDFSDFYLMPSNHMEPHQRRQLQEVQDEELARLLQEQEHKRTKAEVNRTKLRDIEKGDEELARVMQEQEKLRLMKARQRRQRSQHDRPPPQTADPGLPPYRSASVDEQQLHHGQNARISPWQPQQLHVAMDESPQQPTGQLSPTDARSVERWLISNNEHLPEQRRNERQISRDDELAKQTAVVNQERLLERYRPQSPNEPPAPPSPLRPDDYRQRQRPRDRQAPRGRPAERSASRERDPEITHRIVAASNPQSNRPEGGSSSGRTPSDHATRQGRQAEQSAQTNRIHGNTRHDQPVRENIQQRNRSTENHSQGNRSIEPSVRQSKPDSGGGVLPRNLSSERNVNNNNNVDHVTHERSPHGHGGGYAVNGYHPNRRGNDRTSGKGVAESPGGHRPLERDASREQIQERDQSIPGNKCVVNRSANIPVVSSPSQTFNIAMAIDPTYQRRQHEINQTPPEPPLCLDQPTYQHSDLEWDPSVRGSLRRQRAYVTDAHNHSFGEGGRPIDESDEVDESLWQPVQGQRRTTLERGRSANFKKAQPSSSASTKKSGCKQQ